jgi:hypothetical protein
MARGIEGKHGDFKSLRFIQEDETSEILNLSCFIFPWYFEAEQLVEVC